MKGELSMSEDRGARRPRGRKPRRKVCAFCVDKIEYIDYKEFRDVNSRMRRNINERGKIMPRRMSGNCPRPSSAPVPSRCCRTPLNKLLACINCQTERSVFRWEGAFFRDAGAFIPPGPFFTLR